MHGIDSSIKPIEELLGPQIPEDLFLFSTRGSSEPLRWMCYEHNSVKGVACFSNEMIAMKFLLAVNTNNNFGICRLESLKFDEARKIALSSPPNVTSIMLLDKPDEPVIHYVK